MRRTVSALALGLALALTPVAAQAGSTSHVAGHKAPAKASAAAHCSTEPRCRPEPLPVPEGGWPCAADKSCGQHHHYPVCKPPVTPPTHQGGHHGHGHGSHQGHHKPPVTATPVPPILTPASHVTVTHQATLPRTGGMYAAGLYGGSGLVGLGVLLVMFYLLTSPERARVRGARSAS